jgi:RNA polymerase sigma-70 factor (ECF subfamily)
MQGEQELIIQFQQSENKEAPFTVLLKKYQQKVYYQIKRMGIEHEDADDIAQQVWIKVWNKLAGFKMESEFGTWLFRIAYNETINFLEKSKRLNTHSLSDLDELEHTRAETDQPNSTQIGIMLEQAVKQLPDKQRVVFMLRYFEAYSYEKIGEIMDTTVGGAKANFHQAVKKIEKFIKSV